MLFRFCLKGQCRKVKNGDDTEEIIEFVQPNFIQPAIYPPVVANYHPRYELQYESVVSSLIILYDLLP